jgi:hypothetical protein
MIGQLLDRVRIDLDLARAWVDDHEVTATRPADLTAALATALYQTMHVGRTPSTAPQPRPTRDENYESRLAGAVPQLHHELTVPLVSRDIVDPVDVLISGVRVRMPTGCVSAVDTAARRAQIRLPATHAALSPGFLMATHATPLAFTADNPCLRVYLHVQDPDATPEVWASVLSAVGGVPYRSKALSNPARYPRRDAIVVYLNGSDRSVVPRLARAAVETGRLGEEVSGFVKRAAAGVGWAWEPNDDRPGMQNLSFGEHRAHAIAAGLVAHASGGGPAGRTGAVARALHDAGADSGAPYRNLTSPLSDLD